MLQGLLNGLTLWLTESSGVMSLPSGNLLNLVVQSPSDMGTRLPCEGTGMLAPSVGLPFSGWDCLCRKREDDREAWFWLSLALPSAGGGRGLGPARTPHPGSLHCALCEL